MTTLSKGAVKTRSPGAPAARYIMVALAPKGWDTIEQAPTNAATAQIPPGPAPLTPQCLPVPRRLPLICKSPPGNPSLQTGPALNPCREQRSGPGRGRPGRQQGWGRQTGAEGGGEHLKGIAQGNTGEGKVEGNTEGSHKRRKPKESQGGDQPRV